MAPEELESILDTMGVQHLRLHGGKHGPEIGGACPVHERRVGKPDRSPSWSINVDTGLWVCYSCGARGTLAMLSEEVTGSTDVLGEVGMERARTMVAVAAPDNGDEPEEEHFVTEWEYTQFGRVGDRLCDLRGIDSELAWHYGLRWDVSKRCWVIPLRLADGRLVGWQEKAVGYFMNVPSRVEKSACLFGYHQLRGDRIIVVESPLDVARIATCGIDGAVATYGVQVSDTQWRLIRERASAIVLALDNDRPGRLAHHQMRTWSTGSAKLLFANYRGFRGKDPGDASDIELRRILESPVLVPA